MASEYGDIRLLNPHWDELASLVRVYGNWCGPDAIKISGEHGQYSVVAQLSDSLSAT